MQWSIKDRIWKAETCNFERRHSVPGSGGRRCDSGTGGVGCRTAGVPKVKRCAECFLGVFIYDICKNVSRLQQIDGNILQTGPPVFTCNRPCAYDCSEGNLMAD